MDKRREEEIPGRQCLCSDRVGPRGGRTRRDSAVPVSVRRRAACTDGTEQRAGASDRRGTVPAKKEAGRPGDRYIFSGTPDREDQIRTEAWAGDRQRVPHAVSEPGALRRDRRVFSGRRKYAGRCPVLFQNGGPGLRLDAGFHGQPYGTFGLSFACAGVGGFKGSAGKGLSAADQPDRVGRDVRGGDPGSG